MTKTSFTSNVFYHSVLSPQLKKSGVEIQPDIKYREGPYFILSVNFVTIDWIIVMRHFNQRVREKENAWSDSNHSKWRFVLNCLFRMTRLEALEQILAGLYYITWMIAVPLCDFLYRFFLKGTMQRLIVTAVTDDFFKYVEEKGMQMDLQVKHGHQQAAFMLDVMQQMRKDQQKFRKNTETTEGVAEVTRGPLLGPLVDSDGLEIQNNLEEAELPQNLEFVVFNSELQVGYRRLRRAILFNSTFFEEALFLDALNYTDITTGLWDKHDGEIGQVNAEDDFNYSNFIGAKRESQYLMPRSAFVKANMAYEITELVAYDDNFFTVKKRTSNPDVPFGETFCAWTQITIHNVGQNKCHMICSVEPEFFNGPPMVAGRIRSAMRQGVSDVFSELHECIKKYANIVD